MDSKLYVRPPLTRTPIRIRVFVSDPRYNGSRQTNPRTEVARSPEGPLAASYEQRTFTTRWSDLLACKDWLAGVGCGDVCPVAKSVTSFLKSVRLLSAFVQKRRSKHQRLNRRFQNLQTLWEGLQTSGRGLQTLAVTDFRTFGAARRPCQTPLRQAVREEGNGTCHDCGQN